MLNSLPVSTAIFQVNMGQPVFIEAKDDGGGGNNWTTGAISRPKLQPNHHHQQTNIQFFTGRMPFLSPNQQRQSTKGKIAHSMDLLTPSSPGGLPTLTLTTNSPQLPWGRVAMPLISPLMSVPILMLNCWCQSTDRRNVNQTDIDTKQLVTASPTLLTLNSRTFPEFSRRRGNHTYNFGQL